MKWTRVDKHWQELASKANATQRYARLDASLNASTETQPGEKPAAEPAVEPAADADPDTLPVDVQQTPDAGGASKH